MRTMSIPSDMPGLLSDPALAPALEPFRVHVDGDWFDVPGGSRVSCRHRTHLRRLLKALVHNRVQHPGEPMDADALFAIGWPGERIEQRSARNRLKVAMSTLRKMGFGPTLLGDREGYRLKAEVPVEIADASTPGSLAPTADAAPSAVSAEPSMTAALTGETAKLSPAAEAAANAVTAPSAADIPAPEAVPNATPSSSEF